MKKYLTAILILTFTISFSQNEKDLTDIIELVIADYQSDTIIVYHKFDNYKLLSALDGAKNHKDSQYKSELDSTGVDLNWEIKMAEMYDDSVTVEIKKIKIVFFPTIKIIGKKDNKHISRYTKNKLKTNKKKPLAYISFPVISTDQKSAIVYGSYVCGGLCGSGGIFHLKKIKGKWKIVEYEIRWVS